MVEVSCKGPDEGKRREEVRAAVATVQARPQRQVATALFVLSTSSSSHSRGLMTGLVRPQRRLTSLGEQRVASSSFCVVVQGGKEQQREHVYQPDETVRT